MSTERETGIDPQALAGMSREQQIARLREAAPSLGLAERFRLLHELGIYHGEESLSGDGSTLAETRELRQWLPELSSRHGIESLVDVPCGDFYWMSRVDLGPVSYLGLDVVEELVERNRRRFGSASRSFAVHDLTRDPLPRADLVMCRDLLIHLSLADMERALERIRASGSKWLLASHYGDCERNVDIESGDFRAVNLCAPPFSWPAPVETRNEASRMAEGRFADRAMALFRLSDVDGGAT